MDSAGVQAAIAINVKRKTHYRASLSFFYKIQILILKS